jgi:hypothetical protein
MSKTGFRRVVGGGGGGGAAPHATGAGGGGAGPPHPPPPPPPAPPPPPPPPPTTLQDWHEAKPSTTPTFRQPTLTLPHKGEGTRKAQNPLASDSLTPLWGRAGVGGDGRGVNF